MFWKIYRIKGLYYSGKATAPMKQYGSKFFAVALTVKQMVTLTVP